MNHTTNYQLNQWEAADKVQRVDFNADNAKIDAALKAQADGLAAEVAARNSAVAALENRLTLHAIKTLQVTSSTNVFQIPMDDINWSGWKFVATIIRVKMSEGFALLYPSGTNQDSTSLVGSNEIVLLQFPLNRADLPFTGICMGSGVFNFLKPYPEVQGFHLYASGNTKILKGTTVTILGIK